MEKKSDYQKEKKEAEKVHGGKRNAKSIACIRFRILCWSLIYGFIVLEIMENAPSFGIYGDYRPVSVIIEDIEHQAGDLDCKPSQKGESYAFATPSLLESKMKGDKEEEEDVICLTETLTIVYRANVLPKGYSQKHYNVTLGEESIARMLRHHGEIRGLLRNENVPWSILKGEFVGYIRTQEWFYRTHVILDPPYFPVRAVLGCLFLLTLGAISFFAFIKFEEEYRLHYETSYSPPSFLSCGDLQTYIWRKKTIIACMCFTPIAFQTCYFAAAVFLHEYSLQSIVFLLCFLLIIVDSQFAFFYLGLRERFLWTWLSFSFIFYLVFMHLWALFPLQLWEENLNYVRHCYFRALIFPIANGTGLYFAFRQQKHVNSGAFGKNERNQQSTAP